MSINILEIESYSEKFANAILTHGEEVLKAKVWDESKDLKTSIEKKLSLIVEMNYDELISIKILDKYKDEDSIIKAKDKNYIIRGKIIQFVELKNDVWIDLYLQKGAEFISILKSQIKGKEVLVEQGLEIEVTNLMFFPSKNQY